MVPDGILHDIGDALSPDVLHRKSAVVVTDANAPLPPVASMAMTPRTMQWAQWAQGGPRDDAPWACRGINAQVTTNCPTPQCRQA